MLKKSFIPLLAGAALVSVIASLAPAARTAITENLPHQLTAQSSQGQMSATELKGFNGTIISFAISPDGKTLLVAGGDGTISAVNLSNSQPDYSDNFKLNDFSNLAISPDGQVFAAAQKTDIGVFGLSNGEQKMTLRGHAGQVSALAISPDSKTLVSTSGEDRTIRVWNLENGNLIQTIGEDIGPVTEVTFSPDGQYFVTGSIGDYRYIKFWDAATLKLLKTYPQQPYIYGLAITPDGQKLVAAVKNYVKVWDIASGQELWNKKGPNLDINAIAISPDGRQVATANKEGTIMLFEIASGQLLKTLSAQKGWVLAVAFSPDGQYLYGGGEDKTIKIWDLSQ
jgi:WD40 repeat protein